MNIVHERFSHSQNRLSQKRKPNTNNRRLTSLSSDNIIIICLWVGVAIFAYFSFMPSSDGTTDITYEGREIFETNAEYQEFMMYFVDENIPIDGFDIINNELPIIVDISFIYHNAPEEVNPDDIFPYCHGTKYNKIIWRWAYIPLVVFFGVALGMIISKRYPYY